MMRNLMLALSITFVALVISAICFEASGNLPVANQFRDDLGLIGWMAFLVGIAAPVVAVVLSIGGRGRRHF